MPTAPPPPPALTHNERALRAVLDLTLAIGDADGKRAALVIDGSGYQPLPETGELPERPDKPLHAPAVAALVSARAPAPLGDLPVESFRVARAREIEKIYPAIALWMLTREDRAVLIRAPDPPVPGWITRDAVVVVRLRGATATVVGGTLLDCLTPASASPTARGPAPGSPAGASPPAATPAAPPVSTPTAPPAAAPTTRPAAKPAAPPEERDLPPVAAPRTPVPSPRPTTRPTAPPPRPPPPPVPEEPEGEDK